MKKYFYLAAMALTMGLASCSNENEAQAPGSAGNVNFKPIKMTEVAFTAGGSGTVTPGEEIFSNSVVKAAWASSNQDFAAERAVAEATLPEQNGNIEALTTDFLYWNNTNEDMVLDFFPVYAVSSTVHNIGIFWFDEEGNMQKQIIWEGQSPYNIRTSEWKWDAERGSYEDVTTKGFTVTIKPGYKFGFYWNGWCNYNDVADFGYDASYAQTYYSKKELNNKTWCTDGGGNKISPETTSQIHAGTFTNGGNTYLGIEDWTDFDYQDVVFTCKGEVPVYEGNDPTPSVDPDPTPDPDPDPVPPMVDPDPTPVVPAQDPDPTVGEGSVEVNLELEEHKDYQSSHMSIHVRDTTDFEMVIPVPAEYYCPADDMMIVEKHDVAYTYNDQTQTITRVVAEQTVTIDVTYTGAGIVIKSTGINAEVLKELRKVYGDGLTFEIRNYYNGELTNEGLKALLDQTTVSFVNDPKYYINAFGKEGDEAGFACTVLANGGYVLDKEREESSTSWLNIYKK